MNANPRAGGLGARWLIVALYAASGLVYAQNSPGVATMPPARPSAELGVGGWLERIHQASKQRAYTGTFVVSSGDDMAVSKIWHVCDGVQQFVKIETLTGTPRTTLRRNDEVMTFIPDQKLVLRDRRESLRVFPDLLQAPDRRIEAFYTARVNGAERVAGFDAAVVDFVPKDALRYAYRIWSEQKTGLVVKIQTRNSTGQVLEQIAFTELQFDTSLRMEAMASQMANTAGFQVVEPGLRKANPETLGWRMRTDVPGFQPMSSYTRTDNPGRSAVQWVFSDGLASVSLFLENYDAQRHLKERSSADGATHSVSRRVGDYWVTALGEVPVDTLALFIQSLERTR